jgi:sortase A
MIAMAPTTTPAVPPAIVRAAPVALPATGAVLGRIVIPRLGMNAVFRQGVGAAVLADGPGHYPTSALPGELGTVAIAGHRVTHTRPFLQLNRLGKGSRIILVTDRRRIYRVFAMRIVTPTQVWPLARSSAERLVLTACHPPRSDRLRLVVFAKRSY